MPPVTLVAWLLLVWLLGWVALPFSRRIWGAALPDGGLAAGRVLLLAVWTLGAFWAGYAGSPTRLSTLLLGPLVGISLLLSWRDRAPLRATVKVSRRGILISESLFLGVFLLFFAYRGFWPDTEGHNGEKPMDMALISACARADYLLPPNPYAAGTRLNSYYYFGHLETALLSDAVGGQPRWTYSLMFATIPALAFSTLAALCIGVTGAFRGGFAASLLVSMAGTLQPLRQWFKPEPGVEKRALPLENMLRGWLHLPFREPIHYFDTSRVIPYMADGQPHYTINEYPWFTLTYGDLHAHYFGIPLVLLVLSLAWAIWQNHPQEKPSLLRLAGGAAALGALIVTNTWDFFAYSLCFLLCGQRRNIVTTYKTPLLTKEGSGEVTGPILGEATGPRRFINPSLLACCVALLLAVPFLTHLHTAANPPRPLEQPASPARSWLLMWGPMMGAWLLALMHQERRRRHLLTGRLGGFIVAAHLGTLLLSFAGVLWAVLWLATGENFFVILFLLSITAWTLREALRPELPDDATWPWLSRLALCGLIALLWSETTWAGFLDKPYHRQDTTFKFGLQCWYLLGIAATCASLSRLRLPTGKITLHCRLWPWPLRLGFALAIAVMLAATAASTAARARDFSHFEGWDAWVFLAPPEREAAQWLQTQAHDGDNLMEAVQEQGGDYSEYSRFAHATGIPTVLGPQAHTFQWGVDWKDVFERKKNARLFYMSSNPAEKASLLHLYHVKYVLVGELERREYSDRAESLRSILPVLFQSGSPADPHRVTIYGVP